MLALLILYVILEYARPPVLPPLRLQMLIIHALPLLWLRDRERLH